MKTKQDAAATPDIEEQVSSTAAAGTPKAKNRARVEPQARLLAGDSARRRHVQRSRAQPGRGPAEATGATSARSASSGTSRAGHRGDRSEVPDVLGRLLGEHKYNARLLKVLEDQVGLINQRKKPDAHIMSDVMHYMTNFPDKYHHPKEDLIFEKLVLRDPSSRAAVRRKVQAHKKIGADGQALFALLERYREDDAGVDGEEVRTRALAYIKELRRHMDAEELRLFPLAQKVLHKADWQEVDERLQSVLDPVFGAEVAENYRALHRHYAESIKEVEIGELRARFEEAVVLIESLSALFGGLKGIRKRIAEHNKSALSANRAFQRELLGVHSLPELRATFAAMQDANSEMRASVIGDVKSLWNHTSEAARRPFQYVEGNGPKLFRWLAGAHKS